MLNIYYAHSIKLCLDGTIYFQSLMLYSVNYHDSTSLDYGDFTILIKLSSYLAANIRVENG